MSVQGTHVLTKKCIACKSLWIKSSAKCINVNVNEVLFHVFLLIINIGGDLLMLYYFEVFLVCVSLWGHRSLEEQSLWSG